MLNKGGKKILLLIFATCLIAGVYPFLAAGQPDMTSTNYKIWESSMNSGGTDNQTSTSYKLRETIGEVAIGDASSSSYRLKMGYQPMLESYISLSVSTDSVEMLPSIGGLTGGIATGTYSATVITDNPAGYSLYVNASTSPALKSGSYSFADYTTVATSTPDYSWSIISSASEFGFSPEGNDIVQTFKDDGLACATGTNDIADKCWFNFTTFTKNISTGYYSSYPVGAQTRLKLQAQAGSSRMQELGMYRADIITTAIAN
jgi:hypothetical protein